MGSQVCTVRLTGEQAESLKFRDGTVTAGVRSAVTHYLSGGAPATVDALSLLSPADLSDIALIGGDLRQGILKAVRECIQCSRPIHPIDATEQEAPTRPAEKPKKPQGKPKVSAERSIAGKVDGGSADSQARDYLASLPGRPDLTRLCDRCRRIGAASCPACRARTGISGR